MENNENVQRLNEIIATYQGISMDIQFFEIQFFDKNNENNKKNNGNTMKNHDKTLNSIGLQQHNERQ